MNIIATETQRAQTAGAGSSTRANQPGQTEFMQLLAAELRNQNPMQPTSDKDFIAQIAQFSILEQMTQLNATVDALTGLSLLTQGASLVGKWVEILPGSTAGTSGGTVTEVSFRDNTLQLQVDGKTVTLGDIVAIRDQAHAPAS